MDELTSAAGPAQSGLDFSATETWSRLNADPLLLIKRNEVNKVKAKTSNPYLVQQIKEQLRQARDAKVAKKHSKKERKSKKSKHKRRRSRSSDECALALSVHCASMPWHCIFAKLLQLASARSATHGQLFTIILA